MRNTDPMRNDGLSSRRLSGPPVTDGADRAARQRRLGLATVPDARFDALARKIAEMTGAPAAMVNLVGEERQYFAGLYVNAQTTPGEPTFQGDPGREMDLEHGFCPHVVARRKALVLDDIFAYPRFAGNPVVDELGVRSYLGAPLIDDDGTVIGTVCAVDPVARGDNGSSGWGIRGLETIKTVASEVIAEIHSRQRINAVTEGAPGPVLIVTGPEFEILHANTAHERMFGGVPQLGEPAAGTSTDLGAVGVLAAMAQAHNSGKPAVTAPVGLSDGRSAVFAAVTARVPGHTSAVLMLGMVETDAARCIAAANELADRLGNLADQT